MKYQPVLWFLFPPPGSGCVGTKICVVWDKAQHGRTRSKNISLLISEPQFCQVNLFFGAFSGGTKKSVAPEAELTVGMGNITERLKRETRCFSSSSHYPEESKR